MKYKFIWIINYIYSMVWIALNQSNKFEYREKSKVHKWLMDKQVDWLMKEFNI